MAAQDEKHSPEASENPARPFPSVDWKTWQEAALKALKGAPIESLRTSTPDGIEIAPLYPSSGLRSAPLSLGRAQLCQTLSVADPGDCAQQIRNGKRLGVSRFRLIPNRRDEGRSACRTAEDLKPLAAAVQADDIELFLQSSGDGLPEAALLLASFQTVNSLAERRPAGFGCDPLAGLARTGQLPGGLEAAYRQMADLAAWARRELPRARPVTVSSLPYQSSGASAVQELAFTVATGIEYLRRLSDAGLDAAALEAGSVFEFGVGRDFFQEIAKLRAARLLWGKVMAACGCPRSMGPLIGAVTSARSSSARNPYLNLVRGTAEGAAALIGGADLLTVRPFDDAQAQPGPRGRRLAVNTFNILKEESHLDKVMDAAAGSGYLEDLTTQLAESAWSAVRRIEQLGGMSSALLQGWVAERVRESVRRRREAHAEGVEPVVGVTAYAESLPEYPNEDRTTGAPAQDPPVQDSEPAPVSRGGDSELRELRKASASGRCDGSLTAAAIEAFRAGADFSAVQAVLAGEESGPSIQPLRLSPESNQCDERESAVLR